MASAAPVSLFLLLSAAAFTLVASGAAPGCSKLNLPAGENSLASRHLHFFFHEKVTGTPNATSAFAVNNRGGGFSSLKVYDNALRETAELDSPVIGRAQGIGALADLGLADGGPTGGLTLMNLVFTAGSEHNGSTLALMGLHRRNSVSERSIVGGSGRFSMASGIAYSWWVSPPVAPTTVVEFDVYLKER